MTLTCKFVRKTGRWRCKWKNSVKKKIYIYIYIFLIFIKFYDFQPITLPALNYCNLFAAYVEFLYGIMKGIVKINNPFLTYFSLILRDASGHISKIQDIFIMKQTFRYRENVSNLFWHSSKLTRKNQKIHSYVQECPKRISILRYIKLEENYSVIYKK